ncbi:MAG: AAA domain-containing protein, partial [Gemmatimonadales bacterium]
MSLTELGLDGVARFEELTARLEGLLAFFESDHARVIARCLESSRADLARTESREQWAKATEACLTANAAREVRAELQGVLRALETVIGSGRAHPCLQALERAAESRDGAAWRVAWNERERLRRDRQDLATYDAILTKIEALFPKLAGDLRETAGDVSWQARLQNLEEAWAWAFARAWLQRVSDPTAYEVRIKDYHRIQRRIEKATEELVEQRAWKAFFERLNEATVQSLNAWTRAVARIGRGTGKHAPRHRRTARRYLMDCIPSIPAWIMPLHRLWDSVDATTGAFDTIIVDEASQAGVDALALLLLAKRIVVVGDDKQNSPEAVGILEDDIARLAREHLPDFRFRDEYRPDTSLFDHAERSFGKLISLREHFRCVPEIIRFSNDLCYRDAPLIPLRQAPANRLPPLRSRFVEEGQCEGNGQRILNRAEAEALVDTIENLVNDEAYEGKSMGVIALQGHAQAEWIGNLLAQRLHPNVIAQRKIRCGVPASFQGDERDVIFLSLVAAPNVRLRALTRLPDQRRFNVAMSRARDQVWLFHSVKQHDLSPDDLRRRLIHYFESSQSVVNALFEDHERLEREVRGQRHPGSQPEPYESWFEVDVALELLRRGYRLTPQVEVAGRRIDLVVEGVDARLAVECDGEYWHGPEQYEWDMARQRQLERAGWTFVRVRESDFYADPQRAMQAVVEACDELEIRPVGTSDEWEESISSGAGIPQPGTVETDGEAQPSVESVEDPDNGAGHAALEPEPDTTDTIEEGDAASTYPDPRVAPKAYVTEALREIVEREGPLTLRHLYRLYVSRCSGLQRAGRNVRSALDQALWAMRGVGEVVHEDEFGDRSRDGQVLRLAGTPAVRIRPAG